MSCSHHWFTTHKQTNIIRSHCYSFISNNDNDAIVIDINNYGDEDDDDDDDIYDEKYTKVLNCTVAWEVRLDRDRSLSLYSHLSNAYVCVFVCLREYLFLCMSNGCCCCFFGMTSVWTNLVNVYIETELSSDSKRPRAKTTKKLFSQRR